MVVVTRGKRKLQRSGNIHHSSWEQKKIPLTPLTSLCAIFFCSHDEKKTLKLRRHENIETIQAAVTMELTAIPKAASRTCRNAGNSVLTAVYFEGDRNY
jgi:hypothetical protein